MSTPGAPPPSTPPESLTSRSVPSSFDNTEFFEESRFQKLARKIKQEPLIPLGCLATCYALFQASRSIRSGTPVRTNQMFRYRIYAQGFTLVAIVAGSIFYKDERVKRKALEGKLEDKKQSEKKEKWLAELEARDKDDRDWREGIEKQQSVEMGIREVPVEGQRRVSDETKKVVEAGFKTKSMREQIRKEGWGPAMWVRRTSEAWRRM